VVAGKVALITGASRGIGLGIAGELLRSGARVAITARKPDQLEEAVQGLEAEGSAIGIPGNTGDPEHRRDAVAEVTERFGSLDLLVNNAGINPVYGRLVEADLGAVSKIMELNIVAPIGWVQEAWRQWMAEHGGAILNVASVGGVRAGGLIGAYNTSKAALIHLTRQLAHELGPGVRVNAIAPAVVKTRFARALYEGREDEVAETYPLKRLGAPEDIGPIARFLLSDEASWITGETVLVDGGVSIAGSVT
jgi:NAD(P)-dependent dehydrogenase (short-subunit alcohol dehydrogenase family)